LIRHSLLYFLVRAGNGVFAIATLAAFTRLLSPQEYGVYALGMAIATMASAILFQWLNVAVGRFYSMHRDKPDIIMAAAARGFWAATATAALLLLVALPFREMFSVEPTLFGILFLITVALGRHNLALQVANAQRSPMRYGFLSWAKSGGTLLIGFALIHYGAGGSGALLGFLAGLVFAVIAFNPEPRLRMKLGVVDTRMSADMFRYGLPLTLNFLAIVVVDMADRFMIGGLLGTAHVAPYAVAYDLVQQSIGAIMNVLFLAAFPMIVQVLEVEGDVSARIRLRALGNGLVCIGIPAAVAFGVLSSDISEIIFGAAYRQDAARIMPWLAAAIFVGAFKSYFLDVVFQLRHATKYQGYIAALMAAVNVLLNIFLLPRYGVIAAAWATLAAFSVGALASWGVGKSVFSLPSLGKDFLGCASACAVMVVAIYSLSSSHGLIWLSAKIGLGIITYSAMAWLLNVASCRGLFNAVIRRSIG
jgi:O-antigen/teichoic acid export membrane protein